MNTYVYNQNCALAGRVCRDEEPNPAETTGWTLTRAKTVRRNYENGWMSQDSNNLYLYRSALAVLNFRGKI